MDNFSYEEHIYTSRGVYDKRAKGGTLVKFQWHAKNLNHKNLNYL